ncbi:MAG: DUF3370 family protein [Cyanobacteriota bacterium]|nr:DUF3370 family protein [Cyanobacteriota bacterium]
MAENHTPSCAVNRLKARSSCHPLWRLGLVLLGGVGLSLLDCLPGWSYVALMAGQSARPLNGRFNQVPVLHSNQPEEVEGPGILISTTPGFSYAAETGQRLANATYTFNGDFGIHLHHKYFPPYRGTIRSDQRRTEITLGLILINPGMTPVRFQFERGAVRNSFEAPYLGESKMGVRPLGPRPWNTGPGDATAVQMLRGQLDRKLSEEYVLPARSRVVFFTTDLPALGIANALLKGRSSGPFQMAVVAARNPIDDTDLLRVLDQGRLAPGRVYLRRITDIKTRRVFSRVGGVAIGDSYSAAITHDLSSQGALHVPLTSTVRNNFGTRDVQVNPLAARMIDSSLDNVGTYGVRFDLDLNLIGRGPYQLVLSHPTAVGGRHFTAFRGSLQITTPEGLQEMHVGLRSGQSVALTALNLVPNRPNPVRVSLVYPADATPGHLLSVVSESQLAIVQEKERRLELARAATDNNPAEVNVIPPAVMREPEQPHPSLPKLPPPPLTLQLAPLMYPRTPPSQPVLLDGYQPVQDAQQRWIRNLQQN